MFEFTRHKVARSQAVTLLKLPHSSVSHCKDNTHRFTFIVKDEELKEFNHWLAVESLRATTFMREYMAKNHVKKEAA
jgi:hypothetical protein